ncbi:MAG: hypothetical protein Alpg2KO_33070 [Alphaproteobacteria bacterium]
MSNIATTLGGLAKKAEKYDVHDTMRLIGHVLKGLPQILPASSEVEHIRRNCGIYSGYIDEMARTGEPKPDSKKHNLILLHSIMTLKKAENALFEMDSPHINAREMCMLGYRRGRSFLPEDSRPNPAYGEIRRRVKKQMAREKTRQIGHGM